MRILLFCLGWTALMMAQTKSPAGSITVEGKVVEAGNHRPKSKFRVVLIKDGAREGPAAETETDAEGKFRFRDLAAGRYTAYAISRTFVRRIAESFEIRAGEPPDPLLLEVDPPAVITGTVVDGIGEPLTRTMVAVYRLVYNGPNRDWQRTLQAVTDDRGMYRVHGLPPGRYVICAEPVDYMGNDIAAPKATITCYPNSPNRHRAQILTIQAGALVRDISFRLSRVVGTTVSGTVAGLHSTPEKTEVAFLNVMPRDSEFSPGVGGTSTKPDGSFTLRGIPPGSYLLQVRTSGHGRAAWVTFLDVGTEPITGLMLNPAEPRKVTGSITGIQLDSRPSVVLRGTPQEYGNVKPDGSFEIEGVSPSLYVLWISAAGVPDAYIKEVRQGETIKPDHTIDGANSAPVTVVMANDGGRISGRVTDDNDQPLDAQVALIPQGDARGFDFLYRAATTNAKGRFEFLGVPPGRYKLYSWTGIEEGAWFEPGFMERWGTKGQSLTVAPNGKMSFSLRAVEVKE